MLCHLLTRVVSLCAIFYVSPTRDPIGVSFVNNNQTLTMINDQDYLSCFTNQTIVSGPHLYVINDNHHIIHNEETTITLPDPRIDTLVLDISGEKTLRHIDTNHRRIVKVKRHSNGKRHSKGKKGKRHSKGKKVKEVKKEFEDKPTPIMSNPVVRIIPKAIVMTTSPKPVPTVSPFVAKTLSISPKTSFTKPVQTASRVVKPVATSPKVIVARIVKTTSPKVIVAKTTSPNIIAARIVKTTSPKVIVAKTIVPKISFTKPVQTASRVVKPVATSPKVIVAKTIVPKTTSPKVIVVARIVPKTIVAKIVQIAPKPVPTVVKPISFTFSTASASGDPHADTFDGAHHDTMIVGWFTWVKNSVIHVQAYSQLGCMPASIPNTCLRSYIVQITPPNTNERLIVSWGSWPGSSQNLVIQDSTGISVNMPADRYKSAIYLNKYRVQYINGGVSVSPFGKAILDPNLAVSVTFGSMYMAVTLPKIHPHVGHTNGLFGFFNGNGRKEYSDIFRNYDGTPSRITKKSLCQGALGHCGWASQQKSEVIDWASTHVVTSASGPNPPLSVSQSALKQFSYVDTYIRKGRKLLSADEFSPFPTESEPIVLPAVHVPVTLKKKLFCIKLLTNLFKNRKKYDVQYKSCLMDADSPEIARSIAKAVVVSRIQQKKSTKALKRAIKRSLKKNLKKNLKRQITRVPEKQKLLNNLRTINELIQKINRQKEIIKINQYTNQETRNSVKTLLDIVKR